MASPIEEKFILDNLIGNTVFEFGCCPGKLANEISSRGFNVYGCDLYEPTLDVNFTFFHGDFVNMDIGGFFDNIIASSSIEHCGIESENFYNGDHRNVGHHFLVAQKLSDMVTDVNQLIVTVPFGHVNTYYVDRSGKSGEASEVTEPAWGFRTFTKESISILFFDLDLVKCVAYEKSGEDYFQLDSWKEIGINSFDKYNNKTRAVMCCVFKKRKE